MTLIRSAAISTRLAFQMPWRRRQVKQMCRDGKAPMSVLFYHRVADSIPNPWTISNREFERQVDYCREHFELISLEEVQHRLESGHSPRPTATFTFDDGYAENCAFALPLLIRHRIPCTYFVTTANVRTGEPFEHDVRRNAPLPINTVEQLRAAADAGIEMGLHTANHVDFNQVRSIDHLQREIVDAKADLESMLDRPVRYLAVPFGMPEQMRPAVLQTARDCGLIGICSAYGAYNLIGDDSFHIRRFHGDPEFNRFRNWLTFDNRKNIRRPDLPTSDILDDSDDETPEVTYEECLST
ncbi:polysaccharide deacetylase family protein [Rhodopirellula sp. JC737]|nr:polysaccharide deacetylase family protein [Rhodopirellula sp. JC737]